jgi:hypothetical protein
VKFDHNLPSSTAELVSAKQFQSRIEMKLTMKYWNFEALKKSHKSRSLSSWLICLQKLIQMICSRAAAAAAAAQQNCIFTHSSGSKIGKPLKSARKFKLSF